MVFIPSILLQLDDETYQKLKVLKGILMCDSWPQLFKALVRIIEPEFYFKTLIASVSLFFKMRKMSEAEFLRLVRDSQSLRRLVDEIVDFVRRVSTEEILENVRREAPKYFFMNPLLRELQARLIWL